MIKRLPRDGRDRIEVVPASQSRRYPDGMEQDTGEPDDAYYDPSVDMVVTHSGRERWRRRLAEAHANRDPRARAELLARLGVDPDRRPRISGLVPIRDQRSYPEGMRRPDIELPDEAAAYVEQHPEEIARLAANAHADRDGVRARIREQLAAARTEDARSARQAAGQAWLAKYAG
jgi:hypothetical protein